ncbi:MAG: LamG domain-containing protein [Mangrovibacterium sp.]
MKTYKNLLIVALSLILFSACDQNYLDPISKVDPGEDASAPAVSVSFPPEGYELQTNEALASIAFNFEVRDDIEISSISLKLDGTELTSYSSFKDYRVAKETYTYTEVATGPHVFSVVATDTDGNTTTKNVNFTKAPPYTPVYEGEVFYMPFNNEFREMNSLSLATVVGSPTFTSGIQGGTAYAGATDSYLSFPSTILQGSTSMSASFWMKIDKSNDRAGILVVSPPASGNNDRTKGFRFFRESSNDGATQRFKLNVGNGTSDAWVDGGTAADVTPNTGEWTHFAFTISPTKADVYINGTLVKESAITGIDWTNCSQISIMSGAPNWTGWDHLSDASLLDELRIFTKELTADEVKTIMLKEQASFYMDFNGDYKDNISGDEATTVGIPTFAYGAGISGDAYKGATDSYLTFPSADLATGTSFSTSFWLKIDATATRAGILAIAPESPSDPSQKPSGFGFIREGNASSQKFVLLAGNGTNATWFNPGTPATIDPTVKTGWVHFAVSVASTSAAFYMDGVQVSQGSLSGFNWANVGDLSIMSGAPNFSGWNHKSEPGLMDDLYFFPKALSQEEVSLLRNEGL